MAATVADPVAERLAAGRPSRARALVAAAGAGVATAVLVYRLLRSG